MKALLLLFLAVTTLACAEPVMMPVGRLNLLDGRTLKNAVIRSYDAEASKVLVVADGKALLIPIALIPPPYAEKIKATSARTSADLVQTTPAPPSTTQSTTESTPGSPDPYVEIAKPSAPAPAQPSPTPPAPAPVAPVSSPAADRKAHQEAAKLHALRYYKYEFRTGSAIAVTDSDIAIEETEPVPGWTNRFRTTGKVYLEIYESVGGGSFRRSSNKFEILTEQKPGEDIKVVDFTRK